MKIKKLLLISLFAVAFLLVLSIKSNAASDTISFDIEVERDYNAAYEVLDLVNKERTAQGAKSLTMDEDLLEVAMQRAGETVAYWAHTRPDGTEFKTISSKVKAENIALDQTNPTDVMKSWMDSSGHKKNIMNTSYTTIGIGAIKYVPGTGGYHKFWVQVFGNGNLKTVSIIPDNLTKTQTITIAKDKINLNMYGSDTYTFPSIKENGYNEIVRLKNMGTDKVVVNVPIDSKYFDFSVTNSRYFSIDSNGHVNVKKASTTWVKASFKQDNSLYIERLEKVTQELKNVIFMDIANQEFTGSPIEPKLFIIDGSNKLIEGTDYTTKYENNTQAGTATATVTGIGCYSGELVKKFTIKPAYTFKFSNAKYDYSQMQELLNLINAKRKEKGLSNIILDKDLCNIAQTRMKDNMVYNNSSNPMRPNGESVSEYFKNQGIANAKENFFSIFKGLSSEENKDYYINKMIDSFTGDNSNVTRVGICTAFVSNYYVREFIFLDGIPNELKSIPNDKEDPITISNVKSDYVYISYNSKYFNTTQVYTGNELQMSLLLRSNKGSGNSYELDLSCNNQFTWRTVNETMATVSETGLISFKEKSGNVTISTYYPNESFSDIYTTAKFYINESYPLEKISISPTDLKLEKKQSRYLFVSYNPTNTTDDKTVTWTSSNPDVATVNEKGQVTAISGGTVTITATTSKGIKDSVTVEVIDIPVEKIIVPDVVYVKLGNYKEYGKNGEYDNDPANKLDLSYYPSNTTERGVDFDIKQMSNEEAAINDKIGDMPFYALIFGTAYSNPLTIYTYNIGSTKVRVYSTENPNVYADFTVVVVDEIEHKTLEKHDAKKATCDKDGNIEYYYCSECKKYYKDANATNEIKLSDTVIKATGHNYGNWVVTTPATTEHEGVETRTCKNDASHKETRTIPKISVVTPDKPDEPDTPEVPETPEQPKTPTVDQVKNIKQTKATYNTATIQWDAVEGVTGYKVYLYNTEKEAYEYYSTVKTNYVKIKNLKTAQKYKLKVCAFKKVDGVQYKSKRSDRYWFTTSPTKVENIQLISKTNNSFKVNWDKIEGTTAYKVYIYNDKEQKYDYYGKTSDTEIEIKGLNSKSKYTIKVRAYKTSDGTQYFGDYSQIFRVWTN